MTRYTPAQLGQMLAEKNADTSRWDSIEETLARAPEPSPPPDHVADTPRASDAEINAAWQRRGEIRENAIRELAAVPAMRALLESIPEWQRDAALYRVLDNFEQQNERD